MELFSLDSTVETNDIKLTVNSEILMFWIHFSSFHLHWRGYEVEENEDMDDVEREHLHHELQFFDFLYHKFLMYVPEPDGGGAQLTAISLPLQVVEKVFYELDDFIQYCQVHGENELLTIAKNYKSIFTTLFQDINPNTFH
ncbi:Uncharacterised protein [Mycobacteroides abscessus subsp. abscessus]|nr:Uncharacterised protein [Mycobacteroides abscessus subsp. abscessus]